MASRRRQPGWKSLLRGILAAALTIGLLLWFLQGVDLRELGRRLLTIHPGYLLGSFVFTMAHFFLRAWRWRYLLLPLGRASYRRRLDAVVAGYAVNNVLPARGGEVLRPYLLARGTELPFSGTLATVVLERLLDMATVAALFLVAAPFVLAGGEGDGEVLGGPLVLLGVLGLLALLAWTAVRFLGGTFLRWGEAAARWLPDGIRDHATDTGRAFLEGFTALRRGRLLGWVVLASVLLWLDIAVATWLAVLAFGVPFSLAGALFLMGWLAVGIAMPTPAGVGGYHAACRYALTGFFPVQAELAAGIALVLHAISVVPITLWGLTVLAREGIRPGSLSRAAEIAEEDAEETPISEEGG